MEELGISDPSDISDPDLSEIDDSHLLSFQQPSAGGKVSAAVEKVSSAVEKVSSVEKEEDDLDEKDDSEWDSAAPSLEPTPRPGILKNWKQVRQKTIFHT